MDWSDRGAPSLDDLEALARACFADLPAEFQALAGGIAFAVQDFPDAETIKDLELETEFDILGLFCGSDLAEREANRGRPEPTMILLYRRPILDYWAENHETLGAIVRHVLVHEIGHHFGLSDDDMEAIESAAPAAARCLRSIRRLARRRCSIPFAVRTRRSASMEKRPRPA
jgi:predicted Zn-dependent protease with MMP-like domain